MRATRDGYAIGRTPWRVASALVPGVVLIILLVGLLLGFGQVRRTPLFDVGVGLAIAFCVLVEWIILAAFIRRPVLLVTSDAGVLWYPPRAEPWFVPWTQIATLGVHERLVAGNGMRSLVLTLRPALGADDPGAPDRISLPAQQLPASPARCVRLLAERHREQIALNNILVFAEPQMTLARM